MELYHITSKKQGETYVIKDWCAEIDKQGRLSYFTYGKGYRKTKSFELVDVELPLKKDGLYIGEIFAKYGADVASRICEDSFGCCKMSADSWVYGFGLAYNVAKEHFAEKMGEIPTEITNNIRCFFGLFDVEFLEKQLMALDKEYNGYECTYKGETNVSMSDYIERKYGKTANDFVDKLIENL